MCERTRDRARGGATARGYDATWARYSRHWLGWHPWCGERLNGRLHVEHSRCAQLGLRTRATVTDHLVALAQGGAHCSPANSQSLCGACNRRKAIALEGALPSAM